jgi:hypothetical protein
LDRFSAVEWARREISLSVTAGPLPIFYVSRPHAAY